MLYHERIMHWQRGFKRIRMVGAGAMALGLTLLVSVLCTRVLGYAPNPNFESLFGTFWPLGLLLIVLGLLLWLAVWVLTGFLPTEAGIAKTIEANPSRAQFRD
jgi:undecaprenyl pyrophosphate phosphatase UppP